MLLKTLRLFLNAIHRSLKLRTKYRYIEESFAWDGKTLVRP
jgi:hypothetical protein